MCVCDLQKSCTMFGDDCLTMYKIHACSLLSLEGSHVLLFYLLPVVLHSIQAFTCTASDRNPQVSPEPAHGHLVHRLPVGRGVHPKPGAAHV